MITHQNTQQSVVWTQFKDIKDIERAICRFVKLDNNDDVIWLDWVSNMVNGKNYDEGIKLMGQIYAHSARTIALIPELQEKDNKEKKIENFCKKYKKYFLADYYDKWRTQVRIK